MKPSSCSIHRSASTGPKQQKAAVGVLDPPLGRSRCSSASTATSACCAQRRVAHRHHRTEVIASVAATTSDALTRMQRWARACVAYIRVRCAPGVMCSYRNDQERPRSTNAPITASVSDFETLLASECQPIVPLSWSQRTMSEVGRRSACS